MTTIYNYFVQKAFCVIDMISKLENLPIRIKGKING